MEIKIFAQIEVPIDERFSRTDSVTITLGDEAITAIANAIAAQHGAQPTICPACLGGIIYSGNGIAMPCDVCHKIGQSG